MDNLIRQQYLFSELQISKAQSPNEITKATFKTF
jgi:hypothetical protein